MVHTIPLVQTDSYSSKVFTIPQNRQKIKQSKQVEYNSYITYLIAVSLQNLPARQGLGCHQLQLPSYKPSRPVHILQDPLQPQQSEPGPCNYSCLHSEQPSNGESFFLYSAELQNCQIVFLKN